MNHMDPRALRTKQLIQEAFRDLGADKDFETITIKDIANKATINRATFYAHYEDKFALLDEMTESAFLERVPEHVKHAEVFTKNICGDILNFTYDYFIIFYQICRIDTKSIAVQMENKVKKLLTELIESILLKENKKTTQIPNIKLKALIIGSSIYSTAQYWLFERKNEPVSKLIDYVTPFIMNGLVSVNTI